MIVIVGRWSLSRHNFEKSYLQSQSQDCDPGDEIAIAVVLYLSQRGDCDHGKDRAVVVKL